MSALTGRRRAGLLIPLFSCPSTDSWGIGDIGDVEPVTAWLASAGQRVLQLLPLNEMAPGQQSPYSAISAMAIDPIFIRVTDVPEFAALGGEPSLSLCDRAALAAVRRAPRIDHQSVRRLKHASLRAAFERFLDAEWRRDTPRGRALRAWVSEQAWWIEDYSLFRAIHAANETPLDEWARSGSAASQRRSTARAASLREVLFQQYLQWLAEWRQRRAGHARRRAVRRFPFMVDGDSAVWARQQQFRPDASAGATRRLQRRRPGLGMPVYRWDAIAGRFPLAARTRAARRRLVRRLPHRSFRGFYRTMLFEDGGKASSRRPDEPRSSRSGNVLELLAAPARKSSPSLGPSRFPSRLAARLGVLSTRVFDGSVAGTRRPAVP
jgi:4-alpha-glucanotransferase